MNTPKQIVERFQHIWNVTAGVYVLGADKKVAMSAIEQLAQELCKAPEGWEKCDWEDAEGAWGNGMVLSRKGDGVFENDYADMTTAFAKAVGFTPVRRTKPEPREIDGWIWEAKEKVKG